MRRGALLLILLALATAWAVSVGGGAQRGAADHTVGADGKESRGPICNLAPDRDNPDRPGVRPQADNPCVPAVARNLVGAGSTAGKAIPVCAGPHYDASTQEAVRLLNGAGFGRALFVWKGALTNCPHELASGLVSSVIVTDRYYRDPDRADNGPGALRHYCRRDSADRTAWACALNYTVRRADFARVGQAEVRVNPWLDVVTAAETAKGKTAMGTCAPAGHTFDPDTAILRNCTPASEGNLVKGRADGTLELTRHIAHELLHVLGLRDYHCGAAPLGAKTPALMDSDYKSNCRTERLQTANRTDATKALVGKWDRDDYAGIYTPAPVADLELAETSAGLRLTWDAGDVHVKKGFRVERRVGNAWRAVAGATVGPNREAVTIAKPATAQTYRVVSLTDALAASGAWPTVTYVPEETTYPLNVTHGQNGDVSPEGKSERAEGATVQVTADPDTGYVVNRWSATGANHKAVTLGACSPAAATCRTVTMDGPRHVHVTFKKRVVTPPPPTTKKCPTYTFTVSATGGGSVSGGGTYGGKVVAITSPCSASTSATATWNNATHSFEGWTGACTHKGASCTVTNASTSATATFKKRPPPPTPKPTPAPTPEPTVTCLVTVKFGSGGTAGGGGAVKCGKGSVTIWARAGTGYCFTGWTPVFGRNSEQAQNAQTCRRTSSVRVSPQVDITYTANFRRATPVYYRLVVVGGAGGGSYQAGTWATASASAGRCFLGRTYTFSRWTGDSTSRSRVIRIYMSRNKSVTAVYTVGPACQFSEDTVPEDDGGGPAWTEPPETEPPDDDPAEP